ncbi:hypothetical protein FGO68_gene3948 [Halteria grandinella]|uniref:Uncharacterized protein n=1 Tax=Halteria grandinella TaxID=5974 RepID=A0A8J8NFK8_HALGN|nr:hypothetical protein FGO68_gene3948 [Halteria grandinella]
MQKLRILDIGKNKITKANQILVLQNLKLINLNVAGNPCSDKAVSLAVKFPRIRIVNNVAAEKVLETHKSKIPIKIQENTEKNKKKISQPFALYDLEQEVPAPVLKQPKKSVIVKVEKNKKANKKLQKRVKQINLNQEPVIEKW